MHSHAGYMSFSVRPNRATGDRSPSTVTASLRDRALRLAERVTTPLLPSDYLDMFQPLRRGADLRGRIVEVRPETGDAVTVVIRPGGAWQGHVPGQYVRVGVDVDGVRLWRAYSLTSAPEAPDGLLTITVKAVPDGIVSLHLVQQRAPASSSNSTRPSATSCSPTRPRTRSCSSPPAAASPR